MNLSNLPKVVERKKKPVGRGIGSGKGGHTTGRGNKGQKARGKVALTLEGTKIKKSLLKRLPFLRGKGKFKPLGFEAVMVPLAKLADWPVKQEVTRENLVKNGLVRGDDRVIKIGGSGEVKQPLIVKVAISRQAAEKVKAAGGKIDES